MATKKTIELWIKGKGIKLTAKQVKQLEKNVEQMGKKSKKAAFGIHSMRVATSGLRRKLGELRNVLLVFTFAMAGTIRLFKGFVAAFIEQEKVEKQLETALGRNVDALKNYASELQKATIFGDEQILSGMAMIGAFVREEDALKKATKATLDLAAAKGFDLKQAADLIGKTLGSTTNALSRYGIEVVGAVGSTQRLESLVTNVDKAFGGMAAALTDTAGGALKQMTDAMGDLGEVIGEVLSPAIIALSKTFRKAFIRMALSVQSFFNNLDEIGELQKQIFDAEEQMKQLNKIFGEGNVLSVDLAKHIKELGEELNNLIASMNKVNEVEETFRDFMLSLNDVVGENKILMEEAAEKAKEYAESVAWFPEMEKEIKGINIEMKTFNDLIKNLQPANQALVTQMQGLANALGQAVIYGKDFGDAMVSALRAIAAEIISKLAIFLLLEALLPGAGTLGGKTGFLSFLGGGDLNLSKSVVGGGGGTSPENVTNVNLNITNLVGTDEAAVRDQLIPLINQAIANA